VLVAEGLVEEARRSRDKPQDKRRFLELLGSGWSVRRAAREVGVNPRTGRDGHARTVNDPDEVSRYEQLLHPWVNHADTVLAIAPVVVSAFRIVASSSKGIEHPHEGSDGRDCGAGCPPCSASFRCGDCCRIKRGCRRKSCPGACNRSRFQ
jgi:hypothetical protein